MLRSPERTITTNALYVSDSAGNVLSTNPKRNLALNIVQAQQTFVAKVTVCRHVLPNRHSFPVLTIAVYSSCTEGSHKHQACSSRTSKKNKKRKNVKTNLTKKVKTSKNQKNQKMKKIPKEQDIKHNFKKKKQKMKKSKKSTKSKKEKKWPPRG